MLVLEGNGTKIHSIGEQQSGRQPNLFPAIGTAPPSPGRCQISRHEHGSGIQQRCRMRFAGVCHAVGGRKSSGGWINKLNADDKARLYDECFVEANADISLCYKTV